MPGFEREREKFQFCWCCRLQQSQHRNKLIYLAFLWEEDCFLGNRTAWMLGSTHHLEQWSLLGAACSTLRRFGWPTASVEEKFSFCYCLWQRFLPTPSFQQSSTPTQLQGRLGHQLQLAQRSFLCGCIGGFVQRGTADQLGLIVSLRL